MNSCLYRGVVRHRRTDRMRHEFSYSLFMPLLDLDELPHVFDGRLLWSVERPNVASFRRRDHLGDAARPLAECVRDLVERESGTRPAGPVRLLTHLRYFGYCFNPVSFLYCYDPAGERVETVVADVGNTPWNERHPYVLHPGTDEGTEGRHRWRFRKAFHVSPFQGMDSDYDWRFSDPAATLSVHMECAREGSTFFDATLTMERRELTGTEMARALARHPFMTGKVIAGIYWQALRMWARRAPFHTHPAKREGGAAA